MPIVSTDDASRRLRYIYLGPRGWRFPFDARIPALFLCAGITLVFCAGAFAFAPTKHLAWLGCAIAFGIAVFVTRQIMRHVDHDRSLRWWAVTVQSELHTPRPAEVVPGHVLSIRDDLFK